MIHPHALVDDPQCLGTGTTVWAFAHVMAGARVGAECNIGDHAFIESGVDVGDRVTIKNQALLWEGVSIEDDVFIGPRVAFTNDLFPRSARMEQVRQKYSTKENWLLRTMVRKGCSIGANATICPGLELGRFSMIAAGSVVTKDVEPYSLVMGIPARRVGYVCGCGERLVGHYEQTTCVHCGETGADRARHGNGVQEHVARRMTDLSAVHGAVSDSR